MSKIKWGISIRQGRLCWKYSWYWWIPGQPLLVAVWNSIACRFWGHADDLWHIYESGCIGEEDAVCYNCCKHLTGCTGHD